MIERKCNIYGCSGNMRPTRNVYLQPWVINSEENKKYTMQDYRCLLCGNITAWLAFPNPVGAAADAHHMQGYGIKDGYSVSSMMSDPKFYPPKRKNR